MPAKAKKTAPANDLEISDALVDQLLANYEKPEDLLGNGGIFDRLKGRLVQRILDAELNAHLGYEKGARRPEDQSNARNGHNPQKTVKTDDGEIHVSLPRD